MSALSAARRESRAAERCCIIVLTRFNSAWIRGRRIRTVGTSTGWGAAGPARGEGLRAGWFGGARTGVGLGLSRSHSWDSRSNSPWAASISNWEPKMSWLSMLMWAQGGGWEGGGRVGELATRWPKDSRQCPGTRSGCPGRGARYYAAGQPYGSYRTRGSIFFGLSVCGSRIAKDRLQR
jgi:hypothetical protein